MSVMIMTRVKAVFAKPEYALGGILPELRQLRADLYSSQNQEPLVGILTFFRAVSPWHDRGLEDVITAFESVDYGQYNDVIEKLRRLSLHFKRAGRNLSGYNRTRPEEQIDECNIFLGDRAGLWTEPLNIWRSYKGRSEEKAGNGLPVYQVISSQATVFMESHINAMCDIIDELEKIAR